MKQEEYIRDNKRKVSHLLAKKICDYKTEIKKNKID